MSLQDDLQALSEAHGPAALASAFERLQGQVKARRRDSAKTLGPLAQTFSAAMRIWEAEKADGVPEAERVAHLEKTLRTSWPVAREWKYLCQKCFDYGLVMHDCDGLSGICGRSKPHNPHEYGEPCWCSAGARFRPKPQAAPDDFAGAGKTSKPTRLGRS